MDVALQRQSTIERKCKVRVKVSFKKSNLFLILLLSYLDLKYKVIYALAGCFFKIIF